MEDVEKRILQGDQEAFKEWLDMHIWKIERFAIQYGVSLEQSATVAETVFRNRFESSNELTEDDLKESSLLTSTLKMLDGMQPADFSDGLFLFEEDDELHRRLVALPKKCRVPFILNRFYNKSSKEIAEITGMTVQLAEQAVAEAIVILEEPNLDKKLEFLNRSYERFPRSYNEANIFHALVEESPLSETKRETIKRKRPYLFWGMGASILLVLLLLITYTNSEAYQKKSAEKFIEKARASFQKELERNSYLAGISIKDKKENLYTEWYGEETIRKFDVFINRLEGQVDRSGRVDKKKAEEEYGVIVKELEVPSEMVKKLLKKPLVDDEEKSMDFMNEYLGKVNKLYQSYMNVLYENEKAIQGAEWNEEGGFDYESFTKSKSKYPQEFRQAIDGMMEQGYSLKSGPYDNYVYPEFGQPELTVVLRENLHPTMDIYISYLTGSLVDFHLSPIEEQVDLLLQTEKAALRAEGHQELYSSIFNSYTWMLYSVTGMVGQLEIRDSTGTIKEEYKEAWTRIAFNGKNSPSGHVMREVIVEMEDSGWTTSPYLDSLEYFFIEGELKQFIREMKK
ncbi:RNA polymerase sigma factor [Sporosarcina luteola]|uniref:RNA polymerase sigma factor n=1 Tax=Sporosarcina luteola TaxID=582850 RepID=UPI0020423760|nr:sigma factor-like helix-turn-helix DNA-binding protein [Sporosarcina luteola]MCM3711571.1 hypothetical protein [Sporosarcina luteola]